MLLWYGILHQSSKMWKSAQICVIFVCFIQKICSKECFYPKELNLFVLGASCLGTPSATPCSSAFDYNYNTGIPRSWPYSMLAVSQVGRFEIETLFRSWPKMPRSWLSVKVRKSQNLSKFVPQIQFFTFNYIFFQQFYEGNGCKCI